MTHTCETTPGHYADAAFPARSSAEGGGGEAQREFVVVELGAGFGRWSLETIQLGRR
jgi:hypothetical protein